MWEQNRMNTATLFRTILILTVAIATAHAGDRDQIAMIQQHIVEAENSGDLSLLENLFMADAVYLNPEGPPIVGERAILSLYEFMFRRYQWESEYQNEDLTIRGDSAGINGWYTYRLTPRTGGAVQRDENRFEWQFRKVEGTWKLAQLIYGEPVDPRSRVPDLPRPTGKYAVGIRDYFFTDTSRPEIFTEDQNDFRDVAFQVWYPAQESAGAPRAYRNLSMTQAAATFLNWPLFSNSYNVFVVSNSFSDAVAQRSTGPYPVILYNHGYGGFTTVHQTICEELASQGYVVVSVSHAYESALLLKPDGSVKGFDPNNQAYRDRLAEAGGSEQEELKDRIIRAGHLAEQEKYYRQLLVKSPRHQESVQVWAADNRFVLQKLKALNDTDPVLAGLFDLTAIGTIGHSLGGATAGELALTEPTVRAGINLDGFQFGGVLESELQIPFMFIWENGRNSRLPVNGNDLFFQKSKAACYSLVIQGFEHTTFTDLPLFESIWESPELSPQGLRAIKLQKAYIVAFFNKHIKEIPEPLLDGPSQKYSEVIFKSK
ncbi:MAG: DUF4440 domain-containing protein [FCB group bacterium]|nr:DUF4440 domain-containing protein [FCB group bacterium]